MTLQEMIAGLQHSLTLVKRQRDYLEREEEAITESISSLTDLETLRRDRAANEPAPTPHRPPAAVGEASDTPTEEATSSIPQDDSRDANPTAGETSTAGGGERTLTMRDDVRRAVLELLACSEPLTMRQIKAGIGGGDARQIRAELLQLIEGGWATTCGGTTSGRRYTLLPRQPHPQHAEIRGVLANNRQLTLRDRMLLAIKTHAPASVRDLKALLPADTDTSIARTLRQLIDDGHVVGPDDDQPYRVLKGAKT